MNLDDVPLAFDPKSTWVFMVGNCAEWEEERNTIGDVRLHQFFEALLWDDNRVVFVKDHGATRENTQTELLRLLQKSQDHKDTLIFYYGGHGCKEYFCTQRDHWYHVEIVQTIEKHFCGDRVWLLADCCFSGTLAHQFLKPGSRFEKSYLCCMSTQAFVKAGDDWTMTQSLIHVMNGNNNCPVGYGGSMESSTRKYWTLEAAVSYMADETARIKTDCLTVYMHGAGVDPLAKFPQVPPRRIPPILSPERLRPRFYGFCPCLGGETMSMTDDNSSATSRNEYWRGLASCHVGDAVYAKWSGGKPTPDAPYVMPVWFRGRIVSVMDEVQDKNSTRAEVEMTHTFLESLQWTTTVGNHDLVDESYFDWDGSSCSGSVSSTIQQDNCVQAHIALAKKLKYLTFTDFAPGNKVQVLWEDNVLYGGTVLEQNQINWDRLHQNEPRAEFQSLVGAFVPVQWHDEDTWDLMPLSYCVKEDQTEISGPIVRQRALEQAAIDATEISTPRDAIIRSLQASGKTLSSSTDSLLDGQPLSCLCRDREEWVPALACDVQDVPFEALANHLYFDDIGEYYAVQWDDRKRNHTVLPRRLIRKRSQSVTKSCLEAHRVLAKQLKYVSFQEYPPGTRVRGLWHDNAFYGGTIMEKNQVWWERLIPNGTRPEFQKLVGAFVPVRWDETDDDTWDLMPASYCLLEKDFVSVPNRSVEFVRGRARAQSSRDSATIATPRQAILKGLQSADKVVCLSTEALIGSRFLLCLSKDTNEEAPATAVDVQEVPLDGLLSHLYHEDVGEYCAIRWDGAHRDCCLLPKKYVSKR